MGRKGCAALGGGIDGNYQPPDLRLDDRSSCPGHCFIPFHSPPPSALPPTVISLLFIIHRIILSKHMAPPLEGLLPAL